MEMDKEIARIKRAEGGFILEPQDALCCPLLEQLYHGDKSEIVQVIDMTLDDLVQNIREVAPNEGLTVRICGNLRTEPVLILRKKAIEAQIPMRKIFDGLRGDGAHRGVTDLYPENESALRAALKDGLPFDTGWWAVKHEIQSARVSRPKRNGPISVCVSSEMDEPVDLADTAVWEAFGGNKTCDGGHDALTKLGFHDDQVYAVLEQLAQGYDPQTSEYAEQTLHWRSGFEAICKALDNLADYCSDELKARYEGFVDYCKDYIASQKRQLGASCENCKHFHAEIPESRLHPAEPDDCGHPKYFALLSANPSFPFAHGCKFWTIKNERT